MCPPADRPNLASGGLTSEAAARILDETGSNELTVKSTEPIWRLLLAQFNSPVIWLLLAACVVSALVGEVLDAAAIGTIVVINGLVGFFQEYRAEKAVLALRAMTAPRARVIRDGRTQVIAASAVVPGDLLALEAGDIVAADPHLLEANVLSAMEATLTGESALVTKPTQASDPNAPLAQRSDYVFAGTNILFQRDVDSDLDRLSLAQAQKRRWHRAVHRDDVGLPSVNTHHLVGDPKGCGVARELWQRPGDATRHRLFPCRHPRGQCKAAASGAGAAQKCAAIKCRQGNEKSARTFLRRAQSRHLLSAMRVSQCLSGLD